MSKAHDPHWRYVAIKIDGAKIGRRGLGSALKGRARQAGWPDEEAPQLTRFEWPHAIVKVHHYRLAETISLLAAIDWVIDAAAKVPVSVTTLSSSGTIKALTSRLQILTTRGEKGAAPAPTRRRSPLHRKP